MRLVKRYLPSTLVLLLFGLCLISLKAQGPATSPTPTQANSPAWLGQLDTYAKVIGGVVAGLGTLFGLPVVILNFKKTRAEIRKLELEAAALQNKTLSADAVSQYANRIEIVNSDNNTIQIFADPRFLAPLLLLLDFIFAWGILTLAGYVIDFFVPGLLSTIVTALLAGILLVPIVREARRVRRVLRPPKETETENNK